ncbi:GNAT family N-acetyltransferase [Clostridium thermarum]|uniref:GNAT family N-acetyltransferase n=1 Tax=Clostridium thermarum TaxID=1716543 RepID=UPI0013D3CA8E|nr:GNAT family N-acetyltransferase [Clostridium thermarum]
MIIRQMTINDYDEVMRLREAAPYIVVSDADSRENLARFLEKNACFNIVCQIENRIVAAVLCGCDGRRGYIYSVAVEHKYRIRGIGLEMVNEVLKRLRAEGIDTCHLFISKDNLWDQDFWSNTGWEQRNDMLIYTQRLGK